MEYLGLWVMYEGVQPLNKNIEAKKDKTPTTTQKVVCKLIGLVNNYHNM